MVVNGFPKAEVFRLGAPGGVAYGQSRNLGDAALNGVHQPEIADEPREGSTLRVTAAVDVERRGGKIDAEAHAAGGVHPVQAANPHGGILAFGLLGGRQVFLNRRGAVSVVPLIVQHHDWGAVIEFAQHALRKCVRRFLAFVHDGVGRAALRLRGFQGELMPVGH